ncbi:MAG: S-layer homology domain-containing protein [Clostridia bacterium]|nr:S-layer homology domain-containing protein [Clostridia bacterium]
MKSVRKAISTILAVSLILTCMVINIPAVSAAIDYNKEIAFITAVGVSGFNPDTSAQTITRGEFAQALAQALGMDSENTGGTQYFTDVSEENTVFAAVSYLVDREVIDGYSTEIFMPENIITYNEAIKLVMAALGYKVYAQVTGDFPNGYLKTAKDIGFKISVSDVNQLTRGEAAAIIYKMLNSYYVETKSASGTGINLGESDELMMKKIFGIEEHSGIVTALKCGNIYGGTVNEANQIMIDYVIYHTTMSKINDFLGVRVKYYSTEDNVVMYMEPDRKVETVDADFDEIGEDATARNITVEVNNRYKNYKVSSNAFYVYNGAPISAPSDDDIKPEYGEIRLIDNDGDGNMDVVLIWSYKSYIINSVSSSKITVKENSDNLNSIKFDEDGITLNIIYGSSYMDQTLLDSGNVITYAKSKDGSLVTLFVYAGELEGKLSSFSKIDMTAVIDDEKYETAPGTDLSTMIGKTSIFYVDKNGRLAGYAKNDEERVGVLTSCTNDESDEMVYFKILTDNGEFEKYAVKYTDKIRYGEGSADKAKKIASSEVYNQLLGESEKVKKQLVKFALTSDGETLSTLITAKITNDKIPETDEEEESLRLSYTYNTEAIDARYYRQTLTLGSDPNKKYLDIHQELTYVICLSDNEDDCQFLPVIEWCSGDEMSIGNFEAYNRTKLGWYEFIVVNMDVKVESSFGTGEGHPFAVTSIKNEWNDEKEESEYTISGYTVDDSHSLGQSLSLMKDGSEEMLNTELKPVVADARVSRYEKNTIQWEDIHVGDIILYKTNPMNGKVSAWAMLSRAEDMTSDYSNNDWSTASARMVVNGKVDAVSKYGIRLSTPGYSEWDSVPPVGYQGIVSWNKNDRNAVMFFRGFSEYTGYYGMVLRYNSKRNRYTMADWNDISVGDRLMTYRSGSWAHSRGFYVIVE